MKRVQLEGSSGKAHEISLGHADSEKLEGKLHVDSLEVVINEFNFLKWG